MQILVFYVLSLCTVLVSSSPQVQLDRTTLVGNVIAGLKLDFFGGASLSIELTISHSENAQVYRTLNRPSGHCVYSHQC